MQVHRINIGEKSKKALGSGKVSMLDFYLLPPDIMRKGLRRTEGVALDSGQGEE